MNSDWRVAAYEQGQKDLAKELGEWVAVRIDDANYKTGNASQDYRAGKIMALSQMQEWLREKGLLG